MIFRPSPHSSALRRLTSVLCLLTSVLLLPSARAYEWQNSGIWESAIAERAFDTGPSWFSAGPGWLMNALPGSHVSVARARAQDLMDRAGDREGSTPEYNGYVGTLHDVFDVSLFNNVATLAVASTPSKISAPIVLAAVTPNTGDTLTWNSAGASSWTSSTNVWFDNTQGDVTNINSGTNQNKGYNFILTGTGTNSVAPPTSMTITAADLFALSITFQNNFNATNTLTLGNGSNTTASSVTLGRNGSAGAAVAWTITDNATAGSVTYNSSNGGTSGTTIKLYTNGTVSVASGGSLALNLVIADNDVSHTGGIVKDGSGTLTLSGANTYSGGTTLSSGTLQLGNSSTGSVTNGPVGTGTLVLNGGTLSSNSTTARSIANAITFGGDVILGDGTNFGTLTLSGAGTLTGSRTLTLNSDVTYSGNIGESGGSFGLTKAGGGTLILSGVNAYSGGTTVSAGLLQLNSSSALGSSSGSLTVNGGIVDLNGQNISVGNFTGSGGTIWNNGPNAGSSTVTLTTGTNNTGGGTYAGVITDNNGAAPSAKVALTKTGTGTITLSGANTYTGATTVNGGTLLINGSTAAGSAVTVNNSGTLGGTGTVSGTVQVNSGGTLSPGTSPGTLHTGALTLANGSTFAVDLTAVSGNDLLVAPSVTLGTLVTGPSLSLNITGTLSTGQQFFIVNNTGANAVQGVFAQGATITSGQYTFLIDYLANFDTSSAVGGNDIMLEVTALPEASTWIGAALALGAIGLMSRKRFTKRFRVIGQASRSQVELGNEDH